MKDVEVKGGEQDEDLKEKKPIKSASFIIQKYLESPLLIDDRKFDIRVWVMLTQDCRLFVFKEGYIRTSSSKFSLDRESITKPEIHLTNNAV